MRSDSQASLLRYHGARWLDVNLPKRGERWLKDRGVLQINPPYPNELSLQQLRAFTGNKPWVFPDRPVFFLCDVHADAAAFKRSLIASGGVRATGPEDMAYELTSQGHAARFVIGGDCLDKGPSNLELLLSLKHLMDQGAQVDLLAGNHDIRTLLGISLAESETLLHAHLFVRMGRKTLPLLKEVHDRYVKSGVLGDRWSPPASNAVPSEAAIRDLLFVPQAWYAYFPKAMEGRIPTPKLHKELRRIREKQHDLEVLYRKLGLSLTDLYHALKAAQFHFLSPQGEFFWFFDRMRLAYQAGSFLFVHAGVDDVAARLLRQGRVAALNGAFDTLRQSDLFELYHGSVGNCFRTKYRDIDFPLSAQGVRDLHHCGIYAIVHGHRNILHGQRVVVREGIVNFECDASVDRNTRSQFNLDVRGGAVAAFLPVGVVLGISTDYPAVKVFDPAHACGLLSRVACD